MPCPNNPQRALGTWCNVPASPPAPKTVCTVLQEILALAQADAAANPPLLGPGVLAQITTLTTECHLNPPLNPPLSGQQHAQKVKDARSFAGQHNWPLCVQQLQHGH